jgi:hypothetical protein
MAAHEQPLRMTGQARIARIGWSELANSNISARSFDGLRWSSLRSLQPMRAAQRPPARIRPRPGTGTYDGYPRFHDDHPATRRAPPSLPPGNGGQPCSSRPSGERPGVRERGVVD